MKLLFGLASLVVAVALDDVSSANQVEIVGGSEAPKGQHRYVAGLKFSPTATTTCGGSLIAPNLILTAAHCTNIKLTHAVVGTHALTGSSDGELVKILKEVRHPLYNTKTNANDIAIVVLDRSIHTISPVKVSFETVLPNVTTTPTYLKQVSVKTWDNAKAAAALKPHKVDASMLAAGGVKGEDACNLDSGGPLTIEDKNGVRLVGVVSWGLGCGDAGVPGVYSRASTARAFIESYLKRKNANEVEP